jgi:uncharacterized cofD-like protein
MSNAPEISLIGGGTGSFTLLQELKGFTPHISAIVNMSDDGGSSGQLRDEFGVLPPGDARQCLVALSDTPELREVFNYRFGGEGPHAGHSVGNLLLTALAEQHGSFEQGIKVASSILHIIGRVIPVTLDEHTLVLHDGDERIEGEYNIGHSPISPDGVLSLHPHAQINPEATDAISQSDLVVIAPGNLFGSLLPALMTEGMSEALAETKAKKVMVTNLVTKPGQTDDWHVVDYVRTVERYVGEGVIDIVLYNRDLPSDDLLQKYAAKGEFPVDTDEARFAEVAATPIGANLVAADLAKQDENDTAIRRTLIRHDAHQVGRQLMRIFYD